MSTIKARDLKVGMDIGSGWVEEVGEVVDGRIDVTFAEVDPECGETEYFPCNLDAEEVIEI